jgi:SAM-dependent methyltransferase
MMGSISNPWLRIPLEDYEGHMSLPSIRQAQMLADQFERLLVRHRPTSVAIVGCAGGNGLERIEAGQVRRVVGIDINPEFIEAARARHARRLVGAERITIDHWRDDAGYSDAIGLCPGMTPTFPTLQIPYRSLLPVDTKGLLAAGRNLSADTKSHAALREIPQCWAMGEAAGVAATLAVDGGVDVRHIDIGALQAQLVKQGAIVDRPAQQNNRDEVDSPDSGLEDSIHWQAVNEARAFD